MTANKEHKSANYNRIVKWPDNYTVKFNEFFEVKGFTEVFPIWPSERCVAKNREQREALGGGKSCRRYKTTGRADWFVDFEAKAFWYADNV
tara:strand:+ start:803 stop:1075 length:273 start_codon:yes stop_codon:yes gene_type:complete